MLGNDASNITEWKTSSAGGNFSSWFILLLGNLHLADEGGSPLLGCLHPSLGVVEAGCYSQSTWGSPDGSAKSGCCYPDTVITELVKFCQGLPYKRFNCAERAGNIYLHAISCPRELEIVEDKEQMKGWRRDANMEVIDGGDTRHTSC